MWFSRAIPSASLLAALGLLVGCQSAPPIVERTPHGVIRATDVQAGRAYLEDFVEFHAAIREMLPDTRDGDVEIWVGDIAHVHEQGSETAWADAFTLTWSSGRTPRVHLPGENKSVAERRNLIAHELVHALLGPSWQTLPTALEEGLATWVATQLEPRSYQRITKLLAAGPDRIAHLGFTAQVGMHRLRMPDPTVTLAIASARDTSLEEVLSYPRGGRLYPEGRSEKLRLYGVGLALVETIVERNGIDGLHALALRAQDGGHESVPTEWILEAAGAIEPDGRAKALRPALRAEDVLWLLDQRGLWRQLAHVFHGLRVDGEWDDDAEAFVDALDVKLSVNGTGATSWRELRLYSILRDDLLTQIDSSGVR
jgi:hypothetical protein